MARGNRRHEILIDAVGETAADTLLSQAAANQKQVPLEEEQQLQAWARGAATVNMLIKTTDRRAINDQLWRYCASPADYPLQLRTVYGGSEHPHSAEVLDWALPPLAIAASMREYGMSPNVSILSADRAAVELSGSSEEETSLQTRITLQLVQAIAHRYFPDVELEIGRLEWEELTGEPYLEDVALLRDRKVGQSVLKIVEGLEAMIERKGGDIASVAGYLALHNTAYAVYSGSPVVKLAGLSEARFNTVQRELADRHPELIGSVDMDNNPLFVAGAIKDTSTTAPYYIQSGKSAQDVLESLNGFNQPIAELIAEHGLGRVATHVASLHLNGALM